MKFCFMFGHKGSPHSILSQIKQAIENHYTKYGVTVFYVGNRGLFDSLATTAVKQAKLQHPNIQLILLLAYHPAERTVDLTDGFDGSFYPPLENVPRPYAIVKANQYMVSKADSIICYVKHPGNARNLIEYAQRRKKKEGLLIENLAENT